MNTHEQTPFIVDVQEQKRLLLAKQNQGFVSARIVPGDSVVIRMTQEKRVEGTTIRLVAEAIFELVPDAPLGSELDVRQCIRTALYHHGDRVLQYESEHIEGTITLRSERNGPHGHLAVTFTQPNIDLAGIGKVSVVAEF